jgi:hypothetical protein
MGTWTDAGGQSIFAPAALGPVCDADEFRFIGPTLRRLFKRLGA